MNDAGIPGRPETPDESGSAEESRRFSQKVIDEAERLGPDDSFRFRCHPGVSCFGKCCGDINIVLTPYDVLRLRARLGLSSAEFLAEHTVIPFNKEQKLPVPLLKMGDDERKSCLLLRDGACTVYEDRPWACRMYPLGFAAPPEDSGEPPFYFLLDEKECMGTEEDHTQTIRAWVAEQGIAKYDEMGSLFQPLAFDERLADGRELDPKQMAMYWMATYDLDSFRRFVFGSTFLSRFEVAEDVVEQIREDDEALMRFAFEWLAFALSGKKTMRVKPDQVPEHTG